jgi:hypothetical protein
MEAVNAVDNRRGHARCRSRPPAGFQPMMLRRRESLPRASVGMQAWWVEGAAILRAGSTAAN